MIDASSAKKSLKRFVGLVEEIMESKEVESRDSKLSEFISYVNENREIIREAATEETSELISYLLLNVYKSGSGLIDDLLGAVRYIDPGNPVIDKYEITRLFDMGKYGEIISRVTENQKLCSSEDIMAALKKSALNSENYVPVVKYYAECGLFDEDLFLKYAEEQQDDKTNLFLIQRYSEKEKESELMNLLEVLVDTSENPTYTIRLAALYLTMQEKEKLADLLKNLDPSDVEVLQDYLDISKALEYLSDYSRSLLFASSGLSSYRNSRDLMLQKARMLILLRREGEAADVLSELVENYPKDSESLRLVAGIYYKTGDYKKALKYLGLLGDLTEYDLPDYLMLIDSRINLSLFDEAARNIKSAISTFGSNLEVLRYRLKLEKIINDQSRAYSTALEILKLDPKNVDSLQIKFDYLFDKEEYKRFVDDFHELMEDEVKSEFVSRYAASLINIGRFDVFLSFALEKNEVIDSGHVLDAIFYTVRDDEKIASLKSLLEKIRNGYGTGVTIILNRLLGVRPPYEGNAAELAVSSRSYALGYIVCMESIDFKEKTSSEEAERILSTSFFKEISETVDLIRNIYSRKLSSRSNLGDSPRLIYPVVSALLDTGDVKSARAVLDSSYDSKLADPFYYYYDAILQFRKGNSGAARRSVKKALSKLTNISFLTLEAEILLSGEDIDEIKESLVQLADRGLIRNINFEEVYNYVISKGDFSAGQSMVESLSSFNIDDFWLNKLTRDVKISRQELEDAFEYSTLVVSSKKRSFDDIRKHVELLEKLGKKKERIAFLISNSGEHESATIDLWIGDEYYSERDFEEALEYYQSAIKKGTDPSNINNYADTLLETGNLEEASHIIKHMAEPGLLQIKLLYGQGRNEDIINLMKNPELIKEGNEEKLTYITEKLWTNRLVRDALIKAYRSEGYRFLGKLISRKMVESGDYKAAATILFNLLKNYPSDVDSVATLSDVYVKLGRDSDASDLILNSMKYCTTFEQSMMLVDRILRIYYENREYESVTKFYETNRDHVDNESVQYVVRGYIAQEEFDEAEKLLGKYEGNLIDRDQVSELLDEVKAKREFSEILIYVRRLLKLEYKAGRIFDMKESLYKAEIPIEKIEEVFSFLTSEEYYNEVNEEKYEILSRDVFQEIAKKTRVESIKDIKINIIFNNLSSRDVIVAKNLYIYIKRCLAILREPKTKDDVLMKLLRIALRDNLRPEPLYVAVNLNVGISDALEVISLMKYMEDMNRKGGF